MTRFRLTLMASALSAAALACGLPVLGGPTPPASPIPVSTQSAGDVIEQLQAAATSATTGQVSVTFTEIQLTSLVATFLEDPNNQDLPLRDPQVYLREGKIQLYGTADYQGLRTTAAIVIAVNVDADGRLSFAAEGGSIGPMSMPQDLLDTATTTLNEALTGQFTSALGGVRINSVTVGDGQLTLTGQTTR